MGRIGLYRAVPTRRRETARGCGARGGGCAARAHAQQGAGHGALWEDPEASAGAWRGHRRADGRAVGWREGRRVDGGRDEGVTEPAGGDRELCVPLVR